MALGSALEEAEVEAVDGELRVLMVGAELRQVRRGEPRGGDDDVRGRGVGCSREDLSWFDRSAALVMGQTVPQLFRHGCSWRH